MRSLGQLWRKGNDAQKRAVEQLLFNVSGGRVEDETWRYAEDLWEKTANDFINMKKYANPENTALFALVAATMAGADTAAILGRFYAPGG